MDTHSLHLPADVRREVTVEAVIALAAEHNPGDITTSAIARHMGLTQGALFRHFPSKEALWEAVMDWVAARLMARVDAAMGTHSDALDALEAVFLTHCDFVAEHPGVPRMLFGELQRAEDTAAKRVARSLLSAYGKRLRLLITTGQQRGELSSDITADAAAAMFIGAIQGLVMQTLLTGKPQHIRSAAPGVFALYRRCIRSQP
ncbi:TetR/AcrR family transcriptional regulator [Thiomonas bhubaneswarensis]|uniref:Transcriptional regulator, TetR family n=1 Tax=Thiomonas bhubaneswarensis TaxID=339866 RepID=A0A0K6IA23_9BURK|nr:TetR/AcrR family transcriptional regulator [Thiomonas bhubaneswarensis]CUA99878.1 transcriptional regulator, TetR family [Thiomonas bhubaneswarensis]